MSALNIFTRYSRVFSRATGLIVLACILAAGQPAPAASFDAFVKKYENVEISRQSLKNLQDYQHLIEYFCGFAFFKPRHKVHPDFIKALILAESEANPEAISHKDARGLGQILPETGQIAARELYARQTEFAHVQRAKLKKLNAADLYDPAINILLTCYLISKYNYQYDGQLQLVVSAWNAGANAIENNQPPDYRETLDLIGRINGYYKYLLRQNRKTVQTSSPDQEQYTVR